MSDLVQRIAENLAADADRRTGGLIGHHSPVAARYYWGALAEELAAQPTCSVCGIHRYDDHPSSCDGFQ